MVPPGDVPAVSVGELTNDPVAWNGATVRIRRAVVTAQDTYDEASNGGVGNVFFHDEGNAPGHGMQAFAPQIRVSLADKLAPGELVDIRGTFVRLDGPPGSTPFEGRFIPQLGQGAVFDRVGFWESPPAREMTVAEYMANRAELFGTLITLRDLEATGTYELRTSASGRQRIDPFETAEGVRVGAELYRIPEVAAGTRIRRLTGIASYFYDDFVLPRSAADVELEDTP